MHTFTSTKTRDVARGNRDVLKNINTDCDVLRADTANYSSVPEMDCLTLSG